MDYVLIQCKALKVCLLVPLPESAESIGGNGPGRKYMPTPPLLCVYPGELQKCGLNQDVAFAFFPWYKCLFCLRGGEVSKVRSEGSDGWTLSPRTPWATGR